MAMRLRPATPLSVALFIAFVLLLLATISTPILKIIPLAKVNGVSLGVFGYCEPPPKSCTGIQIGYSVDPKVLFGVENMDSEFSLPTGARSSLSSILIVHPIAALFTLIMFIMSIAAHFHAPSHSPKFLIGILIFSIPTLLITLLAFLVDLLLFVPHLAWGGWTVLVSTCLILASGILTCAMRRTLVSRKERKRRIAENDEMNGQNFYANQAPVPMGIRADSPPPLSSTAVASSEKGPHFTAYEKKLPEDDQIPLNTRQPSNRSLPGGRPDGSTPYYASSQNSLPPRSRDGPGAARGGRGGYAGPKDEYGNPLPSSNAFGPVPVAGMRRDRSEPPMRRQYSDETMHSQGSRGGRARGNYPQRGYGRGRPYGPGPSRGGYGPRSDRGAYGPGPGRGGYGPGPDRGGYGRGPMGQQPQRGPPPPGYGNDYYSQGQPGQYENANPAGFARSPSAPSYGRKPHSPSPPHDIGPYARRSPGPPSAPGRYDEPHSRDPPADYDVYNRGPSRGPPSDPGGYVRQEYQNPQHDPYQEQSYRQPSPPMPVPLPIASKQPEADYNAIGQAVEMDARHGSPSTNMRGNESDSTVRGLVGLQQQNMQRQHNVHRDSPMSMTSVYSGNEPYVPPRAAWKDIAAAREQTHSNTDTNSDSNDTSMVMAPVELPEQTVSRKPPKPATGPSTLNATAHGRNQSSDNYYEDVDPRFAEPNPPSAAPHIVTHMPGSVGPGHAQPIPNEQVAELVDPSSSYEDLPDGQRSPASDHSNMTSISQRGVNPAWRPGDPPQQGGRLGVPGGRKPIPGAPGLPLGQGRGPPPGNSFANPPVELPPITTHGQAF